MTVPQIRATHATRVVDLTARQQRNVSIVRALNDALRPVSDPDSDSQIEARDKVRALAEKQAQEWRDLTSHLPAGKPYETAVVAAMVCDEWRRQHR